VKFNRETHEPNEREPLMNAHSKGNPVNPASFQTVDK